MFSGITASAPPRVKKELPVNDYLAQLLRASGKTPPTDLVEMLQEILRGLAAEPSHEAAVDKVSRDRVFLIHGHNRELRETVARFIEKLGAAVILLDELPSAGRTIIEKFESYADVQYAVALMTADDLGSTRTSDVQPRARARQNVVFELGFFTAKLGRSRLSVLYEEGVEMPTDFSGILYIPLDAAGAWRFKLVQELKRAGLRIDLNNVT